MCDVAFAGPIELRTLWIRAREASISLLDWRCQCHSGPPLSRIGPKDIDSTPVFPRYYSPGLPNIAVTEILLNGAGINALIGEVKHAGMSEHMGMNRQRHTRCLSG